MIFPAILPQNSGLAGSARLLWAELSTNRRAAWGVIAIAVLLAAYGLVGLRDATQRAEAAYQAEAVMMQRIAAIARERDWPQRESASAALRASLQQRLWTADSEGLAQANLQAWISGIGREVGLPMFDIRITAAKLANMPPDLREITATISAQPSEPALIALLERLARAPHLTTVSRLHVREQPGPMLELVLVGYARITGAGQSAPE